MGDTMTALRTLPAPDGGLYLTADGIVQSHLHPSDPTQLAIPYVRETADLIDTFTYNPLRVLHLGGGLCTLARYIASTRPTSTQLVVDLHPRLPKLLRRTAPLPPGVELLTAPASRAIRQLPPGTFDVIVHDLFDGARQIPTDPRTLELLAPAGKLIVHSYSDDHGHSLEVIEGK